MRFLRFDETPCAEVVTFPDFNESTELPIGETKEIVIMANKPGEFEFTCQMGMYRGKLLVA